MKQVQGTKWGNGGRNLYDWDAILDGTEWQLTQGEDFTCAPSSFRSATIGAAKKRSMRVRTKIAGNAVIVLMEGKVEDTHEPEAQ